MAKLGDEKEAIQNPLIKYATQVGWVYLPPEEATRLRNGKQGFVLKEVFINQIQKLNSEFMDNLLVEDLIKRLEHVPPTIEGNLAAWEHLKGLKSTFVPYEKRERNLTLIDTKDVNRNTFHVTDEFTFSNNGTTIRPDIVFFINGFPVLFIETKGADKIDGITYALDQIKGYHTKCPELLAILQLYAVTHLISYYYSATWNFSRRFLFNWKEEMEGDFETLVKTFFDRTRIIRLLTDFILFTREDDELKKVVLRPHQMRAVDRIIERFESAAKKRGLIWHTQGSGKTYTMIVAAQKILENPLFENPTIIMLVDRTELETQLFGKLSSVGFENIKVANTKAHLRRLLAQDTRGLLVTMIHKFEDMPQDMNPRENIFVLVDEAHRTTGGRLGIFLRGALPNATYIGFTGTPIDKTSYGEGTFTIFGRDDPPHGYLDKYSIAESIEDGTTVPLRYTLAPNKLLVDRDTLNKEFLDLKEAEGISDFQQLKKILDKAVNLKNMLKNTERVDKVAQYIADHYRRFVEPLGYKAFVVAVDREACALYKKALDKYLPSDYPTVVYSPYHGDPPEMQLYHLTKNEEKRVRKAFRNPEQLPKILIVTEKLLTGFDAPILYCMYLDKPMRDHTLLQAIARVNRPYEDRTGRKKPSGFVLDFVGIFDKLEKALAFDSRDIEGVVEDIELLKRRFSELLKKAQSEYLVLTSGRSEDKAVEAVLDSFKDEKRRHEFYQFFKELQDIYDIISPDAFLRPYLEDFETLAEMYRILKEAYESGVPLDRELSEKTQQLVREYTKSGEIGLALDIFEINEETLRKIEESKVSDTKKVFNLLKSIERMVREQGDEKPYLLSIGERAERVAQLYKERQKNTQQTLDEFKDLIEEINEAQKEENERNMPSETFSIYWLLKRSDVAHPNEKAFQMKQVLDEYPYWRRSEQHERKVKQSLYSILLKAGVEGVSEVTKIAQEIMRVLRGGEE
jgi:type I restriction enzyme R subunit